MVVDIVCNLWTDRVIELRSRDSNPRFLEQLRVETEIQAGVPLDQLIHQMDTAGIDVALMPAVKCGDLRVRDSWHLPAEWVQEACAKYPSRLRGLAGVDPTEGTRGLQELERAVRDRGFVGAHLYPHWFELPPDHASYYPIYAKCCELGIPIMMQVGQCLIYKRTRSLPSVGRPICLDRIACDFPELTIIGIHIGFPWTDEMISVAWKHPNVYIGTDAYAPKHWPPQLRQFIDSWGQDKVMFGTDFPVIDIVRARREIAELNFRPTPLAKLLGDNASRVFDLNNSAAISDAGIIDFARQYLAAYCALDSGQLTHYLAPDGKVSDREHVSTGGDELALHLRQRYRTIKRSHDTWDVLRRSDEVVVIGAGHMTGTTSSGSPFSGVRFIDRVAIRQGKVVTHDTWDDLPALNSRYF